MTAWMKERDRLVQQTMAFVQGVAAQRPVKTDSADVKAPESVVSLFAVKPAEASKPFEAFKAFGASKPFEMPRLFEASKPSEVSKPSESAKPAEPVLKTPTSDASLVEAEALMSLIAKSLPSLREEPAVSGGPVTLVAKPAVSASLVSAPPASKPVAKSSASEPVVSEQFAVSAPTHVSPARSNAPVYVPVPKRMNHFALPQREMIAHCVSNFRAFQLRLIHERENHYATMQAKIRASLGNDSPA